MVEAHNKLIVELNQANRELSSMRANIDVLKEQKFVLEVQLGKIKIRQH